MTNFKLKFDKVHPERPDAYDALLVKWKGENGVTYGEVYGLYNGWDLMDMASALENAAKDIREYFQSNGNKAL